MEDEVRPVLILGMHRSGTSALTRILSILGYTLPKSVSGSGYGNDLGHWESMRIAALSDKIFEDLGTNWYSWDQLSIDSLGAGGKKNAIEELASALRVDFPNGGRFVLKDPRICRIGDLMLEAMLSNGCDPSILIPLRNPMDVAQSLLKRDGIEIGNGLLLWLRYVLDAEKVSRDRYRSFVNFEDLLESPVDELERLIANKSVVPVYDLSEVGREIEKFLDPDAKHFSTRVGDLAIHPLSRTWVSRVYAALRVLVVQPGSSQALLEIDAVRSEFDNATPLLQQLINSKHQDLVGAEKRYAQAVESLKTERDMYQLELASLQSEKSSDQTNLAHLQVKLNELESTFQQKAASFKDNLEESSKLHRLEVSKYETKLADLSAEISNYRKSISKVEKSKAAKTTELISKKRELARMKRERKKINDYLQSKVDELAASEQELQRLRDRIEQSEGEASQLAATLELRSKEISNKSSEIEVLEGRLRAQELALSEAIISNDKVVATLNSKLSDYEVREVGHINKIDTLTELLGEKDSEVVSVKSKVEDKSNEVVYLSDEVFRLQKRLQEEQLTVVRPFLRRFRSFGGSILRSFLPDSFVSKLAFMMPTRQQRFIREMKMREDTQSSLLPDDFASTPISHDKSDIFIFAIIGWHFRTQRPQHIARELCKKGHRVFYFEMDPPGEKTELEEVFPNLFRVKLKLDGVPQIHAYQGVPTPEQQKAWLAGFYGFCKKFSVTSHKEAIIQHPFWWQLVRLLPYDFNTLNDCMDDIAGFDNTTQELIDLEHLFMKECDRLVVSSKTLSDKYSDYNPLNIIRNATELEPFTNVDYAQLKSSYKIAQSSDSGEKKIKIGYVGAIADWFDVELIRDVARARSDCEFHFCGNISSDGPETLNNEANITMYGEIPYEQVPAFLSQMDVLIIPFRIVPIIRACDPVKFYEYSALGIPTVTTPLPELERVKDLAFFANDPVSFSKQIDAAVLAVEDPEFVSKLKTFATENTWAHRAEQFDLVLNDYPLVTVVILAYGDPKLTEAALHSLVASGGVYPHMEILIVDNGSSNEALSQLRSYADNFPDVEIIENGENLGFAGGNNVGLDRANGEFVLLLNNDTYLSPGAILSMVNHLKNNRKTGVVGPLTNNIGNEARLDLQYDNMEQMCDVSWAFKAGYRGKSFKTRVVAYFAVMFRKADLDLFGGLCLDYGRGMFEDDDHCQVIRSKGYECRVLEDAFVHHHLSATFSKIAPVERQRLFDDNKKIFEEKWGRWVPHEYRVGRTSSELLFENIELAEEVK